MGISGNYLYRPSYGAKGTAEFNLFDAGLLAADTELKNCYDHRTAAHTFIGLTDVPAAYTGASLKYIRVNVGETALEFVAPGASTPGGADTQVQYNDGGVLNGSSIIYDKATLFTGIGTTPASKLHVHGGHLILGPAAAGAGNTGKLQFRELAAGGTNCVGFKAPDAIAADVIWTLPAIDGTVGQAMVTDGSGVLSWATFVAGLSNPMTTRGDIITYGATNPARLGIGTAGQVLTVQDIGSGILEPRWVSGGGGAAVGVQYDIQISDGAGGFVFAPGRTFYCDYATPLNKWFYCFQINARFNPAFYMDGEIFCGYDGPGALSFQGNTTVGPGAAYYSKFVHDTANLLTSHIRYYLPHIAPQYVNDILCISEIAGGYNRMAWTHHPIFATLTVTGNITCNSEVVLNNNNNYRVKDTGGTSRAIIGLGGANWVSIGHDTCVALDIGNGATNANPINMKIAGSLRNVQRKLFSALVAGDYVLVAT